MTDLYFLPERAGSELPSTPLMPEDPQARSDRELVEAFLASPRWRPSKPPHFHESIVILRGTIVPHYHAVFDHGVGRYAELRYPLPGDRGWRTVPLPADRAPVLIDRRQQPHIRPRGAYRKHAGTDDGRSSGDVDATDHISSVGHDE